MRKIYFVRHQAHGIVHEYPFLSYPSEEQQAAVAKFCFQRHGLFHKKELEKETASERAPYWTRVEEVDAYTTEVPDVPDRVLSAVATKPGEANADAPIFSVSGSGLVTQKGGE